MALTFQLKLGAIGCKDAVKVSWLKYNTDSGYSFLVSQNTEKPKSRHFAVCCTAPTAGWSKASGCRAHVKAVGSAIDQMEVKSLQLVHTCEGSKRKRNHLTRDVATVSSVLGLCEPTAQKEGNTKQFIAITQKATGVTLKTSQANVAVRCKSHNRAEAQMGQCFWIPSLFEAFTEDNPAGDFVCESMPCPWDNDLRHFHRCCVCLSFAKQFWNEAGVDLVVCDGTHTRNSHFRHIILLAVTFDGDNQLVILAFAIVDAETAENWVWFKENLDGSFTRKRVWMSDADKSTRSNRFSLSVSQDTDDMTLSRCARHISENCRESCEGSMNEGHKELIIQLTKGRAVAEHNKRLALIAKENQQWADWLDSRQDEFATVSFLNRGYRRCGKVTSNGVENVNSAITEARSEPIAYVVEALVKCQRTKALERKTLAEQWQSEGKLLMPCTSAHDIGIGGEAQKQNVELLESSGTIHRARVSVSTNGHVEVVVNTADKSVACPCRYHEEFDAPCLHAKALLLRLGVVGKSIDWCGSRYHTTTYKKSFSATMPAFATAGRLQHDVTFIPPEYKRPTGRPTKKRKTREWLRTTNTQRECKACGGFGHFDKTCQNPSTQYRYKQHKQKAVLWCQTQEAITIE